MTPEGRCLQGFGALPSPAVSVSCPSCRALLVDGALRCRLCGADAREAPESERVGATFSLTSIAPDAFRGASILDELRAFAPEVLAWWRASDVPRRERLVALLVELGEIRKRLRG
jgi:hypothetical protein